MQYLGKVVALAWPVFLLVALWFVVGAVALFYARSTRRPLFLFAGLSALALSVSQSLSPLRAAYRHVTHQYLCTTSEQCKAQVLFGAYKYEWLVDGLAVVLLLLGIILEVSRARKRAARSNAARAANQAAMGAPVAAGTASTPSSAGQYYAQPVTSYGAPPPESFAPGAPDGFDDLTAPTRFASDPANDPATRYQHPAPGSGSFT